MTEDYPSLPEQGKNLAKFTFQVLQKALNGGPLIVSETVYQKRMSICRKCEYFDKSAIRCKHCGCFLQQKARVALDSCPIQKWEKVDETWDEEEYQNLIQQAQEQEEKKPDLKYPLFPRNPSVGEVFEWMNSKWIWNGKMWDFRG